MTSHDTEQLKIQLGLLHTSSVFFFDKKNHKNNALLTFKYLTVIVLQSHIVEQTIELIMSFISLSIAKRSSAGQTREKVFPRQTQNCMD